MIDRLKQIEQEVETECSKKQELTKRIEQLTQWYVANAFKQLFNMTNNDY